MVRKLGGFNDQGLDGWLVGWLIGFNGISTSIGYSMPKPVYTYVQFADT